MKFLVISHPREAHISEAEIQESLAYIADLIRQGKSESIYGFINGGAVNFMNADTAEELWQILHANPLYTKMDWQVEPVFDLQKISEQAKRATSTG